MNQISDCQIFINANADFSLTKGQEDSHYYYNGLDASNRNWRFGLSNATVLLGLELRESVTMNFQSSLKRDKDASFKQFHLEQLNLKWNPKKSRTSYAIGRVIHPFGSFYQKQLSPDLTFLEVPLIYGYYSNISDRIGFMSSLGENMFSIDGVREWGQSINYRYGYMTGMQIKHTSEDEKWNYEVAIGGNSFIGQKLFQSPMKWQLVGRIGWLSSWFMQNGLSFRYASFERADPINDNLRGNISFDQWQLGLDYKIGVSFVEISGEVIQTWYKVSEFDVDQGFVRNNGEVETINLNSITAYLDFKFEPSVLSGSYLAFRIETLQFSEHNAKEWDNAVWRHSFALGYKIMGNALLRTQYSFQNVETKTWNQGAFRIVLTFYI